jgi:hypothetical protein
MTQANNVGILTPKINASGQLDATTGLTGAIPVANGGTGLSTIGANNTVLTSNGTTASWASAASGGLGGTTIITTTGSTQTFTIPTGKTVVKVTVVGAGGGSAGKGTSSNPPSYGAGGGGGASIKYLTGLTPGNTLSVTVGAGGTAGASGQNNGGTGSTSSVASGTQTITTVSATGGSGGGASSGLLYGIPGLGGAGSNGDINITGDKGFPSVTSYDVCSGTAAGIGGTGGTSIFPATVQANQTDTGGGYTIAATAGVNYGSGAISAYGNQSAATAGAAGQTGVVIFEY